MASNWRNRRRWPLALRKRTFPTRNQKHTLLGHMYDSPYGNTGAHHTCSNNNGIASSGHTSWVRSIEKDPTFATDSLAFGVWLARHSIGRSVVNERLVVVFA